MEVTLHIRRIRQDKGISLECLSQQLGITEKTLARLERGEGKLTLAMVHKIACKLEVSPYQLFHFATALNHNPVHTNGHSIKSVKQLQCMMDQLENQLKISQAENSKLRRIALNRLKGDPGV